MCTKKIKDILFPLNIFGKKMQCLDYTLPGSGYINIIASWQGEQCEMAFTQISRNIQTRKTIIMPVRQTGYNGEELEADAIRGYHGHYWSAIGSIDSDAPEHNRIYFKCTNVTSLIVNGETLI